MDNTNQKIPVKRADMYTDVQLTDLSRKLLNPQASFALANWNLARGQQAAPDEAIFSRFLSPLLKDDMVVIRALPGSEFQYGHFGRNVEARAGYSMAGKRVSDFGGELREFHTGLYTHVATSLAPIASLHRIGHYRERPLWDRLILPCADERGVQALYVINLVREIQHDSRDLKVRAKTNGLVVVEFEHDGEGDPYDVRVIGANNAALSITRRRLDELLDSSALACFPRIRDNGLWQSLCDAARTRLPQICHLRQPHDEGSADLDVMVAPFHHGVSIEFSPDAGALIR
jgi:hypothetical protein